MGGKYSNMYDEVREIELSKKLRAVALLFVMIEKAFDGFIESQTTKMIHCGVTTEDVFVLGYLLSWRQSLKKSFLTDYDICGYFMDDDDTLAGLNMILDGIFESREYEYLKPENC